MNRRQLLTSLLVAILADAAVAATGQLVTPGEWIGLQVATLPSEMTVRLSLAGLLAGLVVVNGWIVGRRVVDDDAPAIGRLATCVIVGMPLALLEAAMLTVAYFTLL